MVKSKSSASSATRKKHAKKAAGADADGDELTGSSQVLPAQSGQRGQKKDKAAKRSRFEPKVKSYTPPPPPPRGAPDPVDLYLGGGSGVDPELVVVLRRLGKRDEATVFKAVEGFAQWVADVGRGDGDSDSEPWEQQRAQDELVEVLSVWAHHLPRLALHVSRRLRFATLALHNSLVARTSAVPGTRAALLAPLWTDQPAYVGAWCCSAFDADRAIRGVARRSWDSATAPPLAGEDAISLPEHAPSVIAFLSTLILAPDAAPHAPGDPDPVSDPSILRTQSLTALAYLVAASNHLDLDESAKALLQSEDLWAHLDKAKDGSASGRAAAYDLLQELVGRQEDILGAQPGLLESVARTVLTNCWGERDGWAGVVAFLRRYPEAWTLADQVPAPQDVADSDDSDDDTASMPKPEESAAAAPTSALSAFQTHLSLACTGQPTLYPTVLLLLSTIPASVLPPTADALALFFESFWSAWGSRALSIAGGGGAGAEGEFVKALLECVLREQAAVAKEPDGGQLGEDLVSEWIGRTWQALVGQDEGERKVRRAERDVVIRELRESLERLASRGDELFNAAWSSIEKSSCALFASASTSPLEPLAMALVAFSTSMTDVLQSLTLALVAELISLAVSGVVQDATRAKSAGLLQFVEATRSLVAEDASVLKILDELSSTHLPTLLDSKASPTALAFLIGHLKCETTSPDSRAAVWMSIFSASTPPPAVILKLIDAHLPSDLPSAGLDDFVLDAAQRSLADDGGELAEDLKIVKSLLAKPEPFVSSSTTPELLLLVSSRLETLVRHTLAMSEPTPALELLGPPIEMLAHYIRRADDVQEHLVPTVAIFEVAHLLPNSRVLLNDEDVERAQDCWDEIATVEAQDLVMAKLCQYLLDVGVQSSPIEIINATVALLDSSPRADPLDSLLPTPAALSALYDALSLDRPSPGLSILDPLVSQSVKDDAPAVAAVAVDAAGLSAYARGVLAILEVSARELSWVKKNTWTLPHVLLVADVARDEFALLGATRGLFGPAVEPATLERIAHAAEGLAAYLLSTAANSVDDDWHPKAVAQLRSKTPAADASDLLGVMDLLSRRGRNDDDVYARRAFAHCLQSILKYTEGSLGDAERWLAFAQGLSEGSLLACAIISAIKSILGESVRFVRYQNELASTLAGVPSSSVNSRGRRVLGILLATAPPVDAPIIFLPQQRSMFLIQKIQTWLAGDDDLDDEIYAGIAELFVHLAPIVQELSGGHWDLIFDIIEMNLEGASWDDDATLPSMYHACRLLGVIKDLAARNSELRATSKTRIDKSLEFVRDLFVKRPASGARNAPRVIVLEIMAGLVSSLPVKLLKMGESFDQLVKLLRDPSLAVQRSSYELVDRIAAKYVSDLVVEVELETDNAPPVIELPAELVTLLSEQLAPTILDTPEDYSKASTFLLAWLTAFRFFEKGSPRIKASYIDQLRRLDSVAVSFLPSMFALLGLSDRGRAFDVTPWQVDDFRIDNMDVITETTLPVLATYVYYRSLQAVPSLIRAWWEGCKNRQLSMAVASFTSRHFSPVLIAAELAHLRDPNDPAGKALRDNEDFTVKVTTGANEVKAVFIIDEQAMEIGIRLPAEFPLQGVEVKDVRKVGVTDAQWRAWLLAVQQVITTQNGLIADALSLFKRNVTLHFDGTEPCAICYSIISVVDRSLPSKTCRTCNNTFHAGCLFKWFSTSHGSSCPLCRSLF